MAVVSTGALSAGGAGAYFGYDFRELEEGVGQFQYFRSELDTGWAEGQGAEALGLGQVNETTFRNLSLGWAPSQQPLRQNAGQGDDAAWDVTVSWDKTMSLAYVLGDEETRARMAQNLKATVKKVVKQLESNAITRRGKGGIHHEEVAGLIVVPFWHITSRYGPDPQLHCHLVVMNACLRQDGTWGALHSHSIYKSKMALGRLATAEDSANWVAEGVRLQETERGARIAAIPQGLCDETSSGRKAILERAAALGVSSSQALEGINLDLRPPKTAFNRERLFERWQSQAAAYGVTAQTIRAMYGEIQPINLDAQRSHARRAVRKAIRELEVNHSTFSQLEVTSLAALSCRDGRAGMDDIVRAAKHVLKTDSRVTIVGEEHGRTIFSTQQNERHEQHALQTAEMSRTERAHIVPARLTRKAIEESALDPEQARAVRMTAGTKGSIKLITGAAGTGKTRTLDAVRKAEESAGRCVLGAAPTGVARQELETGAHISESYTVTKLLLLLAPPLGNRVTHHIKMLGKAALKRPTQPIQKLRLGKKDTVIVDEAAMVGFRDLARIIQLCKRSGAKLVLCGDDRQLGPVLSGASLFAELSRRLGAALLVRNWRQRHSAWQKELNEQLASRDSHGALRTLIDNDRLRVSRGLNSPLEACADHYIKHRTKDPSDTLVIASTRAQVSAINERVQKARLEAGELGRGITLDADHSAYLARAIHVGERVVLRRNSRQVQVSKSFRPFHRADPEQSGVVNGDFGEVVSVHGTKLKIRLDRKHASGSLLYATLDTRKYPHVETGYAVTATRAQGKTVKKALLLADSAYLDAEQGYVAMTRQAEDLQVFAHEITLGEDLRHLARSLARTRRQELAEEIRRRLETPQQSPRQGGPNLNQGY